MSIIIIIIIIIIIAWIDARFLLKGCVHYSVRHQTALLMANK